VGEPEKYDSNTTSFLAEFGGKFKPFNNTKKDDATEEIKVFVKKADDTVETQVFKPAQWQKLYWIATQAIWGKGSPEYIQITLQLAVRFGLVTAEGLQAYCDAGKVGLDCNGFVGTYMNAVLGKNNVGANSPIDHIVLQGRPITKPEEIDDVSIYVLGLVDGNDRVIPQFSGGQMGHVMITSPFYGGGMNTQLIGEYTDKKFYRRLTVIESTGGNGLVESDYLILSHKPNGVFTVFRGVKQQPMRVRISRVWI
jgi:hypothetical protein